MRFLRCATAVLHSLPKTRRTLSLSSEEDLKRFSRILPQTHSQNLALTVLYVSDSRGLDCLICVRFEIGLMPKLIYLVSAHMYISHAQIEIVSHTRPATTISNTSGATPVLKRPYPASGE